MFFRIIFVCLVGFVLVKSAESHERTDRLNITFKITSMKVENGSEINCDHNNDDKLKHVYTVREAEEFTIITKYNSYINNFSCSNYNDYNDLYTDPKKKGLKNVTTFKVEKRMGTLWNCTLLANKNNPQVLPVVQYKGDTYSAAYCYMKIHVRQTSSPQTILVNNMVLQANRTDLSETNFDFIAEYQYVDGDVVNVTCANLLNPAPLTMEYAMAGTISDHSTMSDLSSANVIGFVATLHSEHDKSFMICTNTETTDYTKVMVRFMRTEFKNIVSIKINGMTLRPKLKNVQNNHYFEITYQYVRNQLINVVCEVQRPDINLVVVDHIDFTNYNKVESYKKKEIIINKKTEMWFSLNQETKKLLCSADYVSGGSAEQVCIYFTAGDFPIDQYPLQMELLSNGTVMELYNDEKLKVIYYEFQDGETLQLNCGPLPNLTEPGPAVELQMKLPVSDTLTQSCKTYGCRVGKAFKVTRKDYENTTVVCSLKEKQEKIGKKIKNKVLREIRVILRERALTTTSTTTSTTTTSTTTNPVRAETSHASNHTGAPPLSGPKGSDEDPSSLWMTIGVIIGTILCIIIICLSIVIVKRRKRNHSQRGPHNRSYENLQTPSETSIPTYPPQWENNYAVPVDRRVEDTTYSVPCTEPALYSTPTPKNLRNKKQQPEDPTYAILEVPNARNRKNAFKETDDPNYSEVYANREEQCYGKVLPKSARNKMVQDNNPYSYVTNEPAYANTDEPEPMYCEPAKAQGGTYANLNNAHYANSTAQEYVEPTYCEPQKRMK